MVSQIFKIFTLGIQVIWQNSRQKHNIVKRKSSPKVILQFLLTSQKNNKKAEKGDADAITIDSREGQIFWLYVLQVQYLNLAAS